MEQTARLRLPYIMPQQAQKHVTHNEALRLLDGLVQLSVVDRDRTLPPEDPQEGASHIVGGGAGGEWDGWTGSVACFIDGIWERLTPRAGWRAWVEAEGFLVIHDGTEWQRINGIPEEGAVIQNAALVGVGTGADVENPFAAKLNKVLWTARPAGEGGSGDLFYTMNKETSAKDVGLLLQSGYSTRALMGLFGSDDWRLAVSPDGASFQDAIRTDRSSGRTVLPGNPKFAAHLNYDQYIAAGSWTRVAVNNTDYNDQAAFDAAENRFVAPASGLYAFGASVGWKQNGTNVPSGVKARLALNETVGLSAPLAMPDLSAAGAVGGEALLHLHAMAVLAEGDRVELQQFFPGLDGYAPAHVTRFWGHWVA
ncbi:DUF2793 domain-containing protein [Nitratireductor indicus]|uniref:DUF2793 domain-containing protein n=1 Tax=Nitratireductor indicus TaxID=721133 RepID=UPI002875AE99|nr:DUF2793 domain-containing protein [Nitratireductor indicus]MDS1138540.1 DUF2793 domain-containing protein [Nitratireductor indicus]